MIQKQESQTFYFLAGRNQIWCQGKEKITILQIKETNYTDLLYSMLIRLTLLKLVFIYVIFQK